MHLTDELKEQIRSSNDIVTVIGEYVKLQQEYHGSPWYIGLCPFHTENKPSFKVNIHTQTWYCYGCGKGSRQSGTGSDIFSFIQLIEGVTFYEACLILAEKVGITITTGPVDPAVEIAKTSITDHNRRYVNNLWSKTNPMSKVALDYLYKRGLDNKTIFDFRVGLVPLDELNNRNDTVSIAGKIAMPYVEVSNKQIPLTLGMAYREPSDTPQDPKYKNDTTSMCFKKGDLLFGLNLAKEHIKQQKIGIFTECYFGTMLLHQYGIKNAVGIGGTMVTKNQLILARRYAKEWIFLFDPDNAGVSAVKRAVPLCLEMGIFPFIVALPPKEDPDEFIIRIGTDAFKEYLSTRTYLPDLMINEIMSEYDNKLVQIKDDALSKLNPLFRHMIGSRNELKKSIILKRLE
jgi:DNA primase